jgi:hypothetical protein
MDPPVVAHVEVEDITPAPLPEVARPKPVAKKTAPAKEQPSCHIQTLKAADGFGERRVRICDVTRSRTITARADRLTIAMHTSDLTGLLTSN